MIFAFISYVGYNINIPELNFDLKMCVKIKGLRNFIYKEPFKVIFSFITYFHMFPHALSVILEFIFITFLTSTVHDFVILLFHMQLQLYLD